MIDVVIETAVYAVDEAIFHVHINLTTDAAIGARGVYDSICF
jgi:hypothetical protein